MGDDDDNIMYAAELFYNHEFSQKDIAKKLAVSPATVSRLLQQAKERGYVYVTVAMPPDKELEIELKRRTQVFGVRDVVVAGTRSTVDAPQIGTHPAKPNSRARRAAYGVGLYPVAQAAAEFFNEHVIDGDVCVLDGGLTIHAMLDALPAKRVSDLEVLPIRADIRKFEHSAYEAMIVLAMKTTRATRNYLPDQFLLKAHGEEAVRRKVKKAAGKARWVLLGAGPFRTGFTAFDLFNRMGYNAAGLATKHPEVVAVCGYMGFTATGQPVTLQLPEFPEPCLEFSEVQALRKTARIVLLATSREKADAVLAVLHAKLCNTLIVDDDLCTKLISMLK